MIQSLGETLHSIASKYKEEQEDKALFDFAIDVMVGLSHNELGILEEKYALCKSISTEGSNPTGFNREFILHAGQEWEMVLEPDEARKDVQFNFIHQSCYIPLELFLSLLEEIIQSKKEIE